MTAIKKADVAAPVLPREPVPVEALGGDVIVRGMSLSERAALFRKVRDDKVPEGFLQELLALVALDADDQPIFTSVEWDVWAAVHPDAFAALYAKAAELSGINLEVAEKNS